MESLCFRSPQALLGVLSPPTAGFGIDVRVHHPPGHVSAVGRSSAAGAAVETSTAPSGLRRSYYMFHGPLLRLWPGRDGGDEREKEAVASPEREEREKEDERVGGEGEEEPQQQGTAPPVAERRENWVQKILRVRSILAAEDRKPGGRGDGNGVLREEEEKKSAGGEESGDRFLDGGDRCLGCCDAEGSEGCFVGADEGEVKMDRDSFSRLLQRVPLEEVRQFAHLSYLGSLAYGVSRIKPANLLTYHRLRFVTSSLVKRSKLANVEKVQSAVQDQGLQQGQEEDAEKCEKEQQKKRGSLLSASAAYEIAASAASYLQSQTRNLVPFRPSKSDPGATSAEGGSGINGDENLASPEVTSFMATTSSVTAVVAAREETKQAVAEDLNSSRSSPCEWFICDDDSSGTRFFVIQGSESLASWKANLLFEPIQFEGLDVLVHRGIYEAAKGIYEQMLPEVRGHLKSRGDSAAFRFTGHSLGGSLALLVNLMLLIRGEVPAPSLLPVATFGAPSIMCGGDSLLRKLGLPPSHVQAITMHRDIVPRAFSCSYPDHVAEILKAVNGNFRNHPCLNHQKLLYAPMGELLILQPEEKFSPHHHLLPSGTGLYVLGRNSDDSARLHRAAQTVFLNSPHPLETLSDRAAYGADGTVYRDHDVNAYLRSVRGVIHRELKRARKAKREQRRQTWWSAAQGGRGMVASLIAGGWRAGKSSKDSRGGLLSFPIVLQGGRESLTRLGKLAASTRHVHMLVVLLLPAKLLLLGALSIVLNFG